MTTPPVQTETAKRKPAKKSPAMKRYFILQTTWRSRPQGWTLMNKAKLFPQTGRGVLMPPGPWDRGFEPYPEPPHFHLPKRSGLKLYDFESIGEYWIISDRAKTFLEKIAATDCAFLECLTTVDPGIPETKIWLFECVTVLDAVDMERSSGRLVTSPNYKPYYPFLPGNRLVFNPGIIGEHHLFRQDTSHVNIICDEFTKAAIRAEGLTGISFADTAQG